MPTRKFVHNQNVARYRALLRNVTDEATRKVLTDLLDEEDAKARQAGWPALKD